MSTRKKVGYNWKARQQKAVTNGGRGKGTLLPEVEGLSEASYHCTTSHDSNALILPSKRKKADATKDESAPKRKKLSAKQKRRLQKILDTRKKKEQVSGCFLNSAHYTCTGVYYGRDVHVGL